MKIFTTMKKFIADLARVRKSMYICCTLGIAMISLTGFSHAIELPNQDVLGASEIFKFDEGYSAFTDTSPPDSFSTENGNTESSLGGQRLLAFKYALGIIATELRINQEIDIIFLDSDQTDCSYFATASYQYSYANGKNHIADTLYPSSLSNQLTGFDTSGDYADIWIRINSKYLNNECDTKFSYGLSDEIKDVSRFDFIRIMMHELTHGMGFEKRPSSTAWPFVFERFLWVKDQQAYLSNLNSDQRSDAQDIVSNIVFNGRITHQQASNILDKSIALIAESDQDITIPKIDSNVVSTKAMPDESIRSTINILDFDTCGISGSLAGKIVLLPSGCARQELGFNGSWYNGIKTAQEQGALAVITNMSETDRRSAYIDNINIPVLTMPLSDYQNLQSAIESLPANTQYRLEKQDNRPMGTDEYGRPFMHTGTNIGSASILLHWKPNVSPKPVDNRTIRNLMEPKGDNGLEHNHRSIRSSIPALIDLGWAVHSCGDGFVDEFEECDSGNIEGTASCAQNCTYPGYCGDGIVNTATEECDNGSDNKDDTTSTCSSMCRIN